MKMYKAYELLQRFKEFCKFNGWKTSENDDWIILDEKYHNFLLARNVHPSSFKSVSANRKCVVREGLSYRVVKASYIAWLFSNPPSESLIRILYENPDFSKKVAVYDLSHVLEGGKTCIKLNNTDSSVFKEFEKFLKREFKVKIKPLKEESLNIDVKTAVTKTA